MQLPEQPVRTGQPDPIRRSADQLMAAINEIEKATAYRDDRPLPVVGTAPPVPQPGRPPMSQRATDASALMLAGGAATVMVGGGASLVMLASGYADPAVCAIVLGAPAVIVLAVSRLVGRVKAVAEAAPAPTHNHYYGSVTQDSRSITTDTRGLWARTNNHTKES
ncbi:hypothetical protein [Streptomyces sp. NBC_01789]|uniref:hypothetical protein n=1 Tax=Streptomyces sp. NBC_01789 TaxID=2975941 RepID=UPI0022532B18|nr:hypothetical protein [Streptomyces sp. NBC_01789]MCX4450673.1 hypothetical protein [Streptomyces sp. NBC_01789]